MPAHGSRNILTVFIGSPGDVINERKTAREVVDEVNKIPREIGWEIDLRGWEDTLPGHGRPQDIINADVRDCHLFLGLLHARWGTPTGTHSSGFEEEFRLAMELRKERGLPELWLFFKRVSEEQRGDPGDQLNKVLGFRNEIEQGREILFKDIKNSAEWRLFLQSMLLRYILKRYREMQTPSDVTRSAPTTEGGSGTLPLPNKPTGRRGMPAQLSAVFALVEKGTEEGLSEFQAARLQLFSTAEVAKYQNTPMGIHETNLLYRHRTELDALPSELHLLHATVAGQRDDAIPGWYWLSRNPEAATLNLFSLAVSADSEEVRTRAISLLAEAEVPPLLEDLTREKVVALLLRDAAEQSILAKIEYVARLGVRGDLPALDGLAEKAAPAVRAKAEEAHARIRARNDPDRIIAELLEQRQVFFLDLRKELKRVAQRITTDTLVAALQSSDASLRLFAVRQLSERGAITTALAHTLLTDSSTDVKALAYNHLLNTGEWKETEEVDSQVRLNLHSSLMAWKGKASAESLLQEVEWYSVSGMEAYEALATYHFPVIADQLRRDLGDGFETLRSESLKRARSPFGTQPSELLEGFEKGLRHLDPYLRESFTAAALGGLVEHGEPRDAVFARRYLDMERREVRSAAIKLLERFGDESDCGRLVEVAKKEWSIRTEAARAALTLSKRSPSILRMLFGSDDPSLVATALAALEEEDLTSFLPDLGKLSLQESAAVRVLAVACLRRLATSEDLERFLEWYLTKRPYYYDVVCWLDRVLYAPEALRQAFERKLEERFASEYRSASES
jgi:hypothetical protein